MYEKYYEMIVPVVKVGIVMTCQNCNIRPATLHYTKVINEKKAEVHLCEQCAEQSGYTSFFQSSQSNFSFHDLFAGLLHGESTVFEEGKSGFSNTNILRCPDCKMTYEQLTKVGRFDVLLVTIHLRNI